MSRDIEKWKAVADEVETFLYENQEFKVTDQATFNQASELIKVVNTRIKQVDAKRHSYTDPLNTTIKEIMADASAIIKPLEDFVKEVKLSQLDWFNAEEARVKAEQKRIDDEALAKAKEQGVSEVQVPVLEVNKTARTGFATATVIKKWVWKTKDESKVPDEFWCLDTKKIDQAVKDGTRSIPGLEISQENQAPRIR